MTGTYSKLDWIGAGLSSLIALFVYTWSLSTTIPLEDAGQYIVAADHLGVGRTPGYPIWHMLAHGFAKAFSFMEYRGYPNPAWGVNFMSAFFGSIACGFVALITSSISRLLFLEQPSRYCRIIGLGTALSASLVFAFSHAMWSQSVIAESHTLTTSYTLGFIALCLHWMNRKQNHTKYLIILMLGMGLSVTQFLLLLIPIVILAATTISLRSFIEVTLSISLFLGSLFAIMKFGFSSAETAGIALSITLGCLTFTYPLPRHKTHLSVAGMLTHGMVLTTLLPEANLRDSACSLRSSIHRNINAYFYGTGN